LTNDLTRECSHFHWLHSFLHCLLSSLHSFLSPLFSLFTVYIHNPFSHLLCTLGYKCSHALGSEDSLSHCIVAFSSASIETFVNKIRWHAHTLGFDSFHNGRIGHELHVREQRSTTYGAFIELLATS